MRIMVKSRFEDRPNRIPWPPLLYGGLAVAGFILHYAAWRLPWPQGAAGYGLAATGIAAIVAALLLDIAAFRAFRKHQTTIMPHQGASRLITDGPFRYSRNPIYLGNFLLVGGLGLVFGIVWLVIAALLAAFLVQKLAIEREEAHLALKFGDAWQAYARQTPRWLWFL